MMRQAQRSERRHAFGGVLRTAMAALVLLAPNGPAIADSSGRGEGSTQDLLYLADDGLVVIRLHVRVDGRGVEDVWDDAVDQLFAELDQDGDGTLSPDEAAALPNPGELVQLGLVPPPISSTSRGSPAPDQPNLSASGSPVTRGDLADWLRRSGLSPFTTRVAAPPAPGDRQRLTGRMQPAAAPGDRLLELLDRDGDGRLSREELERAAESLRKHDLDDDGTISAAELQPLVSPFVRSDSMFAVAQQPQTAFTALSSGAAFAEARQALERYGGDEKRLLPEQLSLPDDVFARYDADGDGRLDFDELVQFLRSPEPQIEIIVRIGQRTQEEAAIEVLPPTSRRVDLSPYHHAAAEVRWAGDDLAAVIVRNAQLEFAVDRTSGRSPGLESQWKQRFHGLDTDGNGYLDREEAARSPEILNAFRIIDRDGDGRLIEEEVLVFAQRWALFVKGTAVLSVSGQGRNLFDLLDLDGDGRISPRELAAAAERLPLWDANGDGRLDPAEIPRNVRLTFRRGTVGSGRTVVQPAPAGAGRQSAAGPGWFRKMDRNGDRVVTRREFLGSDEQFRQIDVNGDGLIDAAEAAAVTQRRE